MRRRIFAASVIAILCVGSDPVFSADPPRTLQPPSAFTSIVDTRARSAALFTEAGKVIQSPRCLNCHPPQRQPTQGDELHAHVPFMRAGAEDHGVKGLPCASCHGPQNVATLGTKIKTVPGDPRWSLAPASMAWQGKSLGEICVQVKDPQRNGGHTLAQIHEHMAKDHLVGWAWRPGDGRIPAPGTQDEFGALIKAWIDTGAHCPAS
jgi:cytochrome c553